MKPFHGFPREMRFTPLPNIFFSQLIPQIDDLAELKVMLHLFWVIYGRRGYPRFVTYGELLADRMLMKSMGDGDTLRHGLDRAVSRGTIIRLNLERDERPLELYFLNTEGDRKACARIEAGEIDVAVLPDKEPSLCFPQSSENEESSNIFTLYEENIGMLTPMIADQLKDAEQLYPASWIEDAFKEAVSRNKRSWKYIEAILKRWASEGRVHGARGRYSKEDPEKYFKGPYGHLVKR